MWLVLYFRFILNSDHDSAAGDRTSPNSTKSSCNARLDHTFGSGVEIARSLTIVRLVPKPDSCTAAKKHRYSITAGRIARCPSAALRVLCANKSTGCWQLNNKASRAQVQLSQYRFWSRRQTAYLRKMPLPSRQ